MVMLAVDRADRLLRFEKAGICLAAITPTALCRPLVHHLCVRDSMLSLHRQVPIADLQLLTMAQRAALCPLLRKVWPRGILSSAPPGLRSGRFEANQSSALDKLSIGDEVQTY